MTTSLFIKVWRESTRNGRKLAGHQGLDKIHSDDEVGNVEESAPLNVGKNPERRTGLVRENVDGVPKLTILPTMYSKAASIS